MLLRNVGTLGALILLPAAVAQVGPTFNAASIKPTMAEPGSSSSVATQKGSLVGRNVTLRRCIRSAYGLPESQIFGGPKWVDDDRFDIEAKATGPSGDHDLSAMFQTLLAERFQLAVHRETRPLAGYALVPGKGRLLAKPSAPDTPPAADATRKSIDARGYSMGRLAQKLAEALHVPVADLTAIDGRFDFHLEWTPEDMQAKASAETPIPGVSIFVAVQEQLGLKLEPRKVPTEVIVIDRVEKPSRN